MSEIPIRATSAFMRKASKLMTKQALDELLVYLSLFPEKGDLIAGAGGVRKLRWRTGKNDRGKSAGVRVIYHYSKDVLILLITLYSKSEKENLSNAERNELKQKLPLLVAKFKGNL